MVDKSLASQFLNGERGLESVLKVDEKSEDKDVKNELNEVTVKENITLEINQRVINVIQDTLGTSISAEDINFTQVDFDFRSASLRFTLDLDSLNTDVIHLEELADLLDSNLRNGATYHPSTNEISFGLVD